MNKSTKRELIFYGDDFWDFYHKQNQKVKERINWTLGVVCDLDFIPEKYFKHITGTDLYEIRVSSGNNIFRIFCFMDKGNLIVVLGGFQKKTIKTPKEELKKALNLQNKYYYEKKK